MLRRLSFVNLLRGNPCHAMPRIYRVVLKSFRISVISLRYSNFRRWCAFRRSRTAFRDAPEQANEPAQALMLCFLLRRFSSLFAVGYSNRCAERPTLAAPTKSVFDHARNAVRLAPEYARGWGRSSKPAVWGRRQACRRTPGERTRSVRLR